MTNAELDKAYQETGRLTHKGRKIAIAWMPFPVNSVAGAMTEIRNYYLVAINTTVAPIRQRHALGHELAHVFLDHLDRHIPVMECEAEANKYAWDYYRAYRDGKLGGVKVQKTAQLG